MQRGMVICAGRQYRNVAGIQGEDPALAAAEADAALATRDSQRFMDSGVVVYVIVDTVTPGIAPSIGFGQILDHGRRIVTPIEISAPL